MFVYEYLQCETVKIIAKMARSLFKMYSQSINKINKYDEIFSICKNAHFLFEHLRIRFRFTMTFFLYLSIFFACLKRYINAGYSVCSFWICKRKWCDSEKMLRLITGCVIMTQSDGIHLLHCCVGI